MQAVKEVDMYADRANQPSNGSSGFVSKIVPLVVCLVAWVSVALSLATTSFLYQVAMPLRILCAVVFTGFLLRSALLSTDRGVMPRFLWARWSLRAQRSVLPLALLPIAEVISGAAGTIGMLIILVVSILAFRAVGGSRGTVQVQSLRDALRDPFDSALGVLVLIVGVQYLSIAYQTEGLGSNDAAYYFGMARHFVATGSFDEPLVWHYLAPPDQIVHPAFDYWSPAFSLALSPALAVFGNTERVANMTSAAISFASVALFWYVICVSVRLRHGASRFVALVIFAYMPALSHLRFCPDTVPLAQVFVLLIIVALTQKRFVMAVVAAFLLFVTRGDTVPYALMVWGIALVLAWKKQQFRAVLITCVAIVALYVLRNVLTFGTVTPPGGSLAPFLERYLDLYVYRPGGPEVMSLGAWLSPMHAFESGKSLVIMLRNYVEYFPNAAVWFLLAVVAWFSGQRSRQRLALVLAATFVLGVCLTHFVAGKVFSPVRTLRAYDPLLVLVGALGFDAVLELIKNRITRWMNWSVGPRAFVVSLVMIGLLWIWLSQLAPYGHRVRDYADLGRELEVLDDTLAGDHVASDRPWFFLAYTKSPAIMIPGNGPEAIEAAILHYKVSWLVIDEEDPEWMSASRSVVRNLTAGQMTQIGRVHFKRVSVDGRLHVFHVSVIGRAAQ